MNFFGISAASLAVLIYATMAVKQMRGKMPGLSFATMLLWGLLDAVAASSLYIEGGEWLLPAAYVGGCAIVLISLLKSGEFSWSRLDTFITMMVIGSIVVWYLVGPVWATVVSTLGVVLACVPQTWEIIQKPQEATAWIWLGFTITNAMSIAAGSDWSVQERFYPTCCTVATAVMLLALLALRKLRRPRAIA